MDTTSQIQIRKRRWMDFYQPSASRRQLYWIHSYPGLSQRPWPYPDRIPERIQWAWDKYQIQSERLHWLDDDSLPFLDIYTGTEIFAEAFGCEVFYPQNDMPFARPLVTNASQALRLTTPRIDCPSLARVWEIARELRRRAGPEALVRLPDIQSPMDITALIWEKSTFYPALVEEPESVLALAAKVHQLLTRFLDAWFEEFGSECIAHFPDYYVPRGITLSEDEIGAVSPEIFKRIFLPELNALSNRYGAIGMHCCANAKHQWEGFLDISNLFLLNLVQPPATIREAYQFFSNQTAQMHSFGGDGDAKTWHAQVSSTSRVVFDVSAASPNEAIALCQYISDFQNNQ